MLQGRDVEIFRHYARQGVYGTILGAVAAQQLSLKREYVYTFADYSLMRPGDLVFFFTDRRIYGVGKLVGLVDGEPVLCNWPESDDFRVPPENPQSYLWTAVSPNLPTAAYQAIRWICAFRPSPAFFTDGIDMDYALGQDAGGVLRHLRVLSGRSFFRLEDDECDSLMRALLRRNEGVAPLDGLTDVDFDDSAHQRIQEEAQPEHRIDPRRTLRTSQTRNGSLEGGVHCWIAHHLARKQLGQHFSEWSYIGNLEVASPFKPREYMEEMDLFGYSERERESGGRTLHYIDQYKVIEVKGDQPTLDVVRQVMKYVDWLANERAGGYYSLLRAWIVVRGPNLDAGLAEQIDALRRRRYVEPVRPYESRDWAALTVTLYTPQLVDARHLDLVLTEGLAIG